MLCKFMVFAEFADIFAPNSSAFDEAFALVFCGFIAQLVRATGS